MADAAQFSCEACGKIYRWKQEIAGRRVKCGCGTIFQCPQDSPIDDDGLFALAPQPTPARPALQPVASTMNTVAAAIPAKTRPLAYRAPAQEKANESSGFTIGELTIKDFYAPIALIVLGTLFRFLYYMYWLPTTHHRSHSAAVTGIMLGAVVIMVTVGLVIDLVLTFIAILIAASVADMSFGHPVPAILKLLAIGTVVPIVRDLSHLALGGITIGYGLYFGFGVSYLTYAIMFMWLFELDWAEARICAAIVWVLNIIAAISIPLLLLHFIH